MTIRAFRARNTRLNWRQAKEAIGKLIGAGLIRQDKGGSKPRYYVMPPHLIQGCEDFVAPSLTPAEKELHERMGKARNKSNVIYISKEQEYKIACDLATRGTRWNRDRGGLRPATPPSDPAS